MLQNISTKSWQFSRTSNTERRSVCLHHSQIDSVAKLRHIAACSYDPRIHFQSKTFPYFFTISHERSECCQVKYKHGDFPAGWDKYERMSCRVILSPRRFAKLQIFYQASFWIHSKNPVTSTRHFELAMMHKRTLILPITESALNKKDDQSSFRTMF